MLMGERKSAYSEIIGRMFEYTIRMMDPSVPFLRRKSIAWVLNEMLINIGEGGVKKTVAEISMEDVEEIAKNVIKFLSDRVKRGLYD